MEHARSDINYVKDITKIVIYGASGHAAAFAHTLEQSLSPTEACETVAFIDDHVGGNGARLFGKPVISFEQWRADYRHALPMVAVGSPPAKRRLVERLLGAGAVFRNIYERSDALHQAGIEVGVGAALAPQVYVGPKTRIGAHVHIMPMCSIGHDVVIGDYSTISPGCTISGHLVIESEVFIGAGSTVVNGRAGAPLVIGRSAFVAAGSTVTKSIPAGGRVAGNPARPLREIAMENRATRGGSAGDDPGAAGRAQTD